MKVFAVSGLHKTGKTTVVECLIRELTARGLKVGTVKDIHFEGFSMDKAGTNTDRHRAAGACMVAARALGETDFLIRRRMDMKDVVSRFGADVVIIEGGHDEEYPRITCAKTHEDADMRLDGNTFAISGLIAEYVSEYKGMRVINCLRSAAELADLSMEKAMDVPEGRGF